MTYDEIMKEITAGLTGDYDVKESLNEIDKLEQTWRQMTSMTKAIIFPCEVFFPREVDSSFQNEYDAAGFLPLKMQRRFLRRCGKVNMFNTVGVWNEKNIKKK